MVATPQEYEDGLIIISAPHPAGPLATAHRLSDIIFLLRVTVVVGLVSGALLALLLSFVQPMSYLGAAYSTLLTGLLIGPAIYPKSAFVDVLIALAAIDGLAVILAVMGIMFAAIVERVVGQPRGADGV